MILWTRAPIIFAVLLTLGCGSRNYQTAEGPRYVGAPPPHITARAPRDTLRVATFNIAYAIQVDSALAVIQSEPELRDADVLLLQEMDGPATRYIARELGMWFVYYPATLHFRYKRDFGNAVLSRYPIVEDKKIILPHPDWLHGSQRIATAATIRIDTTHVRVYSAHLGTYANNSRRERNDQLAAIITDATSYSRVIIGGDMNDPQIGAVARENGYAWPTEEGPRTAIIGRLDHIFVKGLFIPDTGAAGTVQDNRNSSDHLPVWAVALINRHQ